ncbi:hypothetical protein LINPERHAP1_LOCUS41050 [Linum perenne]
MRIRVSIDIRQPLKKEKRLRKVGGARALCKFQYEKLPNFCYICGKIGHIDRYCEVLFHVAESDIVRRWDETLRATPRRAIGTEMDRWLVRRPKIHGVGTSGEKKTKKGGEGLEGRKQEEVPTLPATIHNLLGNLGASLESASMPLTYGTNEDDVESLDIQEERKRRREGDQPEAMEEDAIQGTGAEIIKSDSGNIFKMVPSV